MEETEVVTERSVEDLDSLADKADTSRNDARPMVKEAEVEKPQTQQEMLEFVHNGKPVKATKEQIIKWAQQGYDYPQKIQKFNQDKAKWEQDRSQLEGKFKVYQDIDSWAAQNPQQWQRLEQLWKSGQITQGQAMASAQSQAQGQGANDPYASRFQTLEQTQAQIAQTLNQLLQKDNQVTAKQADETLDKTIQSIREKYKDLDWESLDENGKSTEIKVLEHARNLGISDGAKAFTLAFKDLFHDQIVDQASAQAKINVSKGIQQKTKLGVLGESPTSKKINLLSTPKDIRNMSYNDLAKEGLAEVLAGKI